MKVYGVSIYMLLESQDLHSAKYFCSDWCPHNTIITNIRNQKFPWSGHCLFPQVRDAVVGVGVPGPPPQRGNAGRYESRVGAQRSSVSQSVSQ